MIDNASDDDSGGIAISAGADRLIQNPINAGFAVAASQGIALANGTWIIMINPDLVIDISFLQIVDDAVKNAPANICCFAPEIRFAADNSLINSCGIAVDSIGIPSEIGKGQLASAVNLPTTIFGASGGGAILRRSALDEVGGFEPAYFAYYEDDDLSWRLQRAGYRALLLPTAKALHAGSSTVGVASPLQTYLVARNRRLLFYRHGPHDLRTRVWRGITDLGHAGVSYALTRCTAPFRGRAAALFLRPYLRFLRRTDATFLRGTPDVLVPRVSFRAAIRRKLQSITLERGH